ncbi:MAG TPA: hypothetical protein VFV37_10760 [Luteibaculaceae bacterium]|nr:hypothetical protein [Luteibaculaceae bacterium]
MRKFIFAISVLLFACHEPELKVMPEGVTLCAGNLKHNRNNTEVVVTEADNLLFFELAKPNDAQGARADLRWEDTNGKEFILTLKDYRNLESISTGFYRPNDLFGRCEIKYLNKDLSNTRYLADSVSILVTSFNEENLTISGNYHFRMIDSTAKDTIRFLNGRLTDVCLRKIKI